MSIRVVAVGQKMPAWVRAGCDDYAARMPAEYAVEWREVRAEPRTASGDAGRWLAREAERIRAALAPRSRIVVLDERGDDVDTAALARRLSAWRAGAAPVAILIGGPDGLARELKQEAAESLRLSSLTLPHALVRIVLAEQLFRAWSILAGHPYHRAGEAGASTGARK